MHTTPDTYWCSNSRVLAISLEGREHLAWRGGTNLEEIHERKRDLSWHGQSFSALFLHHQSWKGTSPNLLSEMIDPITLAFFTESITFGNWGLGLVCESKSGNGYSPCVV